jgi:NCS1 family nucleobase:cation symporter-1
VWTSALNSALAGIGIADYFFLRRQKLDLRALHGGPADFGLPVRRRFQPHRAVRAAVGFIVTSRSSTRRR